jgi:hypothetical protein
MFAPISGEGMGSAASPPPPPIATTQERERIIAEYTAGKKEDRKRKILRLQKAKNDYFKLLDSDEDTPFDQLTREGLERFCREADASLVWDVELHGPPERCSDAQTPLIEKRQCVNFLMQLETDELQHCPLRDIFSTLARNMTDSVREACSGAGFTSSVRQRYTDKEKVAAEYDDMISRKIKQRLLRVPDTAEVRSLMAQREIERKKVIEDLKAMQDNEEALMAFSGWEATFGGLHLT